MGKRDRKRKQRQGASRAEIRAATKEARIENRAMARAAAIAALPEPPSRLALGALSVPIKVAARSSVIGRPIARPLVRIGDDEIGYCIRPDRPDDCLRAAIATATQIPIEDVPDLFLDDRLHKGEDPEQVSIESWTRIGNWLASRGLEGFFRETVPVDRDRWIGVCEGISRSRVDVAADDGDITSAVSFDDHCLVMSYDRILFDPGISFPVPAGKRLREWEPSDVTYGIIFDPIKE